MNSGEVASTQLNGSSEPSHQNQNQNETEFYEEILRLRDDVLAGKHPRYKLSEDARQLETLPSSSVDTLPAHTAPPPVNGEPAAMPHDISGNCSIELPNGIATSPASYKQQTLPAQLALRANPVTRPAPATVRRQPVLQRPVLKPFTSGIDPVLLSKSDQLVKAEIQLKRQRIERALKDQVDLKKAQGREKEAVVESSLLDVTRLLKQALDLVKPISGLKPPLANGHSPNSETFDENSYYSSQANEWSSDDANNSQRAKQPQGKTNPINLDHAPSKEVAREKGKQADRVLPPVAGELQVGGEHLGGQPSPGNGYRDRVRDNAVLPMNGQELGEGRDESYSPPAAEAFSVVPANERSDHGGNILYACQLDSRQLIQNRDPKAPAAVVTGARPLSPPSAYFPIVRTQIASPLAPQPSRISPLAVARAPVLENAGPTQAPLHTKPARLSPRNGPAGMLGQPGPSRSRHASPRRSVRQSPDVGKQQPNKNLRKRRREMDPIETGPRASRRKIARSPEPYIKEEPLSPPPLAYSAHRPVASSQHRKYEYIELHSAQGTGPVLIREALQPQRGHAYEIDAPTPQRIYRVSSQNAYRTAGRDDTDSKRVVSLQHVARQPSPPGRYLPQVPVESHPNRAASFAYVDRSTLPQPRYVEELRTAAPLRSIRSDRSVSPHLPREPVIHCLEQSEMMPPPPPRYIVDQYGTKYYAALPDTEMTQMVAPLPRLVEVGAYHDRQYSRQPVVQASSRSMDLYRDEDHAQRMPMPPRRVVELPDVGFIDPRAYRQLPYEPPNLEAPLPREEYASAQTSLERRPVSRVNQAVSLPGQQSYYMGPSNVQPEYAWREPAPQTVRGGSSFEHVKPYNSMRPVRDYAVPLESAPPAGRAVSTTGGDHPSLDDRMYIPVPQPQRRGIAYDHLHERPMVHIGEPYVDGGRRISYKY